MQSYCTELLAECRRYEKVHIYGAKKNAEYTYYFLERYGIKATDFLVTDRSRNPDQLIDLPVIGAEEFAGGSEDLILVATANRGKAYLEIFDYLAEKKVRNIYFLSKKELETIQIEGRLQKANKAFNSGKYRLAKEAPVELNHAILAMNGQKGEEYHWRVSLWDKFPCNMEEAFQGITALEEYEKEYGKYYIFQTLKGGGSQQGTYAVYMARSHVDNELQCGDMPAWVIPIQVGAALTKRSVCEVKDNTGENISERNGNYSECTAIYWMWKNAPKTDYIGLCHYRRHFDMEEKEIGILAGAGVDVLVTSPTFVSETVGVFFSTLIPKSDLQAMLTAIEKVQPAYLPTAEKFLKGRFFPPCNLFIMRYGVFREYAEFLFSVTFEIERFFSELGYYRSDRYMGYLIECLMGIFLAKNQEQLKIAYTDMRFLS